MILRDIARARENIQKSLAGVSTAAGDPRLAPAPPGGAADPPPVPLGLFPSEQSQGEVCGAVFLPGLGPGPRPPQETPARPCRASHLLAGAHGSPSCRPVPPACSPPRSTPRLASAARTPPSQAVTSPDRWWVHRVLSSNQRIGPARPPGPTRGQSRTGLCPWEVAGLLSTFLAIGAHAPSGT